jgi:hypothetical protein
MTVNPGTPDLLNSRFTPLATRRCRRQLHFCRLKDPLLHAFVEDHMRVISPSPGAQRGRRHHAPRALLIALGLLCVPALSLACKGGIAGKSPENPSAVLAIIGGAAVGWKSLMYRLRK